MRLLVTLAFFLSLIAADTWADQISIPYPPQANTKAKAAEMKANLDAIVSELNAQDLRVTLLEDAKNVEPVSIDCGPDPAALLNALRGKANHGPPLWFEISGVCEIGIMGSQRAITLTAANSDAYIMPSSEPLSYDPLPDTLLWIVSKGGYLKIEGLNLVSPWIWVEDNATAHLFNNYFYDDESAPRPMISAMGGHISHQGTTSLQLNRPTLFSASAGGTIDLANSAGELEAVAKNNANMICRNGCRDAQFSKINVSLGSSFCVDGENVQGMTAGEMNLSHNSVASLTNEPVPDLNVTLDTSSIMVVAPDANGCY